MTGDRAAEITLEFFFQTNNFSQQLTFSPFDIFKTKRAAHVLALCTLQTYVVVIYIQTLSNIVDVYKTTFNAYSAKSDLYLF